MEKVKLLKKIFNFYLLLTFGSYKIELSIFEKGYKMIDLNNTFKKGFDSVRNDSAKGHLNPPPPAI